MSSESLVSQPDGASSAYPLCPVCSTVSRLLSNYHTKVEHDGPIALIWTLQIRELITAAEGGCEFCWFITKTFFTGDCSTMEGKFGLQKPHDESQAAEQRKLEVQRASERASRILETVDDDSFKFSLVPDQEKTSLPNLERMMIKMYACRFDERIRRMLCGPRSEILVEVYAKKGDPAAQYIETRPWSSTPSSPETFEKAHSWLHECIHEHPSCPKPEETQLPIIVVDVSAADRNFLKLHDQGGKERYAVLICGAADTRSFATTLETMAIRLKGFSKSGLPQTLQDAITVTQEMGLKYLWIDSLCRLQNFQNDHYIANNNLADIFKNAYFAISAAHAENYDDGFLGDRATRPSFDMPYVCPDDSLGTICMSRESNYNHIWEPINRDPWTLQAQLLSPRLLIYGSRFLWQCQTAQHSDGGIEDWSSGAAWTEKHRLPSEIFSPAMKPEEIVATDLTVLRESWYAIVKEYTRRKLSEPDDILPAIADIASEVQKLNRAEYLAGLWKDNLVHELMWTAGRSTKSIPASKRRAPSWSWASVENGISFGTISADSEILAEVLNCSVSLASLNAPFGQVTSGQLKIEAPLKQIEWSLVEKIWEEGAPLQLSNDERTRNMELMAWMMGQMNTPKKAATGEGEPQTGTGTTGAWLLKLFRRNRYLQQGTLIEKPSWSGLVLEEAGTGTYKRVGVFFDKHEEWMEGWDQQTIIIE